MDGEGAGKGDTPRPFSKSKWDENYLKIFKDKRKPKDFQKDKKDETVISS